MGCASSKPSKEKKNSSANKKLNKKSRSTNDVIQETHATRETSQPSDRAETPIHLDKNLVDQIKSHEVQVVEYISKIVRSELNNELTGKAVDQNQTSVTQQENDDLIIDVSSKAINSIVNTPLPNTSLTYKSLNTSLRSWKFLCKNQTNKARIIDLTTDTIRHSLTAINEELARNSEFDLLTFIAQNSTVTPPETPVKEHTQEDLWNDSAVLMNRTKANQIARLLFLSNKARPVIHSSTSLKDAYFVNRELKDKSQVTITQAEVDEILNNSTYKNNPHITPVTGRKLDFNSDLLKAHRGDEPTISENDTHFVTIENTAAAMDSLIDASDFEKVEVINLTIETTNDESTENHNQESTSVKTELVNSNQDTEFLDDIVNEINNLQQASTTVETSVDTDQVISETAVSATVTPPTTPEANDGLVELVQDIIQNTETTESNEQESKSILATGIEMDKDVIQNSETTETNEKESKSLLAKGIEIVKDVIQNSEATESSEQESSSVSATEVNVNETEVAKETNNTNDSINTNDECQEASNDSQTLADDGKLDPVLKQELLDDRFYNNDSFKNGPPVNGTDAENDAATKIQASFKGEETRQGQNGEANTGAN